VGRPPHTHTLFSGLSIGSVARFGLNNYLIFIPMHMTRWIRLLLVFSVLQGVAPLATVQAAPLAQTNLLTNPGFEDGWYHWNNVPEMAIPNGWDFWYADSAFPMLDPQDSAWGRPETVTWLYPPGFAESYFWRDGSYTLKVFGAWRPIWWRLSQRKASISAL